MRRALVPAVALALPLTWIAIDPSGHPAAQGPTTISVIDVSGDLSSTRVIIENYAKANPQKVKAVNFQRAPAPELPAKIKAQQDAGRVDVNLLLVGQDAGSVLANNGQLIKLFPQYDTLFPRDELTDAGKVLQAEGEGFLLPSVVSNGGPVFIYNPARVKPPPRTADEFKAWVKANPGKFMYARPANSGPGRSIICGLPHVLGDKNPRDPVAGWDKTWAFLKELDSCIEYYPSGTSATMKEFGEGSRDMTMTVTGWDINPRVLGIVPKATEITTLDGFHWVADTQFMCIPKGVPKEKVDVLLQLMSFMLKPEQQALTYDKGYFYPGPAVKDVPLNMATKESQDILKEFGRPEYDKLIAEHPVEVQLPPQKLVAAFRRWDQDIGAQRTK